MCNNIFHSSHFAVADPGFLRGGGVNPKVGTPSYYLVKFPENCIKMKNERIRTQTGRASLAPPPPPLRSANTLALTQWYSNLRYHLLEQTKTDTYIRVKMLPVYTHVWNTVFSQKNAEASTNNQMSLIAFKCNKTVHCSGSEGKI